MNLRQTEQLHNKAIGIDALDSREILNILLGFLNREASLLNLLGFLKKSASS